MNKKYQMGPPPPQKNKKTQKFMVQMVMNITINVQSVDSYLSYIFAMKTLSHMAALITVK